MANVIQSKAVWRHLKDARSYTVNAQANIWDAQQVDNEDPKYSLVMAISELQDAILSLESAKRLFAGEDND